ncbi:MAG TPA: hypothetical protein DHU59_03165 [Clostridiales bacterium]|nr:hypothetical protein [Clostridiales bacterium]
MKNKSKSVLEFDKIIEKLAEFAETSLGKEEVRKLDISSDLEGVQFKQKQTAESVSIIIEKGAPPLGGFTQVKEYVKRGSVGGIISLRGLLNCADSLRAARLIKNYVLLNNKEEGSCDILEDLCNGIYTNKDIEENNKLLGERLRAMYKSGTSGYIELILNAENLTDAMTRVDMVQLIVESDVELLKSIEEQKKKVEEVKLSLENEKLELADVIKELSDKKESVETASKAKDDYISSLEQDIKSLELLMVAEEAQSSQIERDILSLQGAGEFSGGGMSWPLPGYSRISSYFGGRADPITGAWSNHRGIDIPGPYGQPIVSSNDGIVIFSGYHWSYGNYVIIDHGGGISTLYSHASKLLVGKGQAVSKGETIALVGSTGYSTGNHVHFEYRINGVPQNPLNYVK